MARIRSVHPAVCEDESLVDVSASAERTFVRLWTHLDDEGRCVDNAKLIKAALYPLHDDMTAERVNDDLAELECHGLVVRYSAGGKSYLAAKPHAWTNYQKPRHPSPSKLPAPPEPGSTTTAERRNPPAEQNHSPETDGGTSQGVVVGDGVGEGVVAPPKAARKTDPLFDAFAEEVGHRPLTDKERAAWNGALKELRQANATPEQVHAACRRYRSEWPNTTLTLPALAKHFGRLVNGKSPPVVSKSIAVAAEWSAS